MVLGSTKMKGARAVCTKALGFMGSAIQGLFGSTVVAGSGLGFAEWSPCGQYTYAGLLGFPFFVVRGAQRLELYPRGKDRLQDRSRLN